ncbi:MAG: hypothetical protein P4L51_04800 [Puia sp.]|nr:hypothetical protein [Puia sp.]
MFVMILGIRYLQNKENMVMIEKGMDPKLNVSRPAPYRTLKWGLLLVGAGLGLFAAYLLDHLVLYNFRHVDEFEYHRGANVPVYFALIAVGGGLGLILSYRIEKKEVLDKG